MRLACLEYRLNKECPLWVLETMKQAEPVEREVGGDLLQEVKATSWQKVGMPFNDGIIPSSSAS